MIYSLVITLVQYLLSNSRVLAAPQDVILNNCRFVWEWLNVRICYYN